MRYLTNTSTDPYFNLAFDEYCLENIFSEEPYFYLWRNRPSVIIGLNQNAYAEVDMDYLDEHGISLARRVTGGGAVYHDLQNLNYTIIGGKPTPEVFAAALRDLGLEAQLTGRNDIFIDGKKVSGYARRVRRQEIIHGTLLYDVDMDAMVHALSAPSSKLQSKGIASVRSRVGNLKDLLPQFGSLDELQSTLETMLADGDAPMELSSSQLEEIACLAREKFASWDFIYGHSHQAGFTGEAKLPCGMVRVNVSIDKGLIREVHFEGDFLFDSPAEELARKLEGKRCEPKELEEFLLSEGVEHYFTGADAASVARLLCMRKQIQPIQTKSSSI